MSQPQQDKKGGDLKLIEPVEKPIYPISVDDRLDSHYFIAWNLKRWRKSVFRMKADPEVGWFGFLLFCEAHDESPVGTLPTDEQLLAKTLGISVEHWRTLQTRETTPLHNWSEVLCDNGETRLGHPVVTKVTKEALKSMRANKASTEARKRAKRIKDLTDMITRIGAVQLLRAPQFLDKFNDWLEEKHPDVQRRQPFIENALDEFQLEMGV